MKDALRQHITVITPFSGDSKIAFWKDILPGDTLVISHRISSKKYHVLNTRTKSGIFEYGNNILKYFDKMEIECVDVD